MEREFIEILKFLKLVLGKPKSICASLQKEYRSVKQKGQTTLFKAHATSSKNKGP